MSSGRQQNKRYPNGFSGEGGLDLSRLAAIPDGGASGQQPQQQFSVVMFDDRPFRAPQEIQVVPYLEMAYRARRGDEAAALTLATFGIQLWDAARRPYWPMEAADLTAAIPGPDAAQAPAPAESAPASEILLPPGVEA